MTEQLYFDGGTPLSADQMARVEDGKLDTAEPCSRCGGAGGSNHWPGFTCFRCGNRNSQRFEYVTRAVYTQAGLDALQAERDAAWEREQRRVAQAEEHRRQRFMQWVSFDDATQAIYYDLMAYEGRSEFLQQMRDMMEHHERLTGDQYTAARRVLDEEKAKAEANALSSHVGTVGERLTGLEVTVDFTKVIEPANRNWSSSVLVRMRDADGNVFVTFSTAGWAWEVEKGDTVRIRGTVKAHDTYEGTAQTTLTRTAKEND